VASKKRKYEPGQIVTIPNRMKYVRVGIPTADVDVEEVKGFRVTYDGVTWVEIPADAPQDPPPNDAGGS
jgi:hypothetical protein